MKLAVQLPRYNYGHSPENTFKMHLAQVREAERSGFDVVFLMDHLCQVPAFGPAREPVLEAYTTMAALAACTETVELGALVTGNPYRNPALLAKMVTTIDVISGGRAVLGLGAGWMELEHRMYGYRFGTASERFEMLEESLRIIIPMLRGEQPTVDGTWARADRPVNEPRVRDSLPVLLGGSGEKKTFGLAARHADRLNIECSLTDLPRKLAAVDARCGEAGRDRSSLHVSVVVDVIMAERSADAHRMVPSMFAPSGPLGGLGADWDALDADKRDTLTGTMVVGSPDEIADQVASRVMLPGVDGLVIKMLPNANEPGMLEMAARALRPIVDAG